MNIRLASLIVVLPALLLSCQAARPETKAADPVTVASSPTPPSAQEVRVTREGRHAPAPCRPDEIGEMIVGFLKAINEGLVEASSFFASDMEWYSVSEWSPQEGKRHFVSNGYQPEELESYFARRALQREVVHLLEINVGYERARNLGHVAYTLERTADDLPRSDRIVIGKGAIDCATGKIAVWSMSHDTRFQRAPAMCPGEAKPPRIAIACARA